MLVMKRRKTAENYKTQEGFEAELQFKSKFIVWNKNCSSVEQPFRIRASKNMVWVVEIINVI